MATFSLTGKDTAMINDRVLNDFADGDNVLLDFPNDLVKMKIGKGGNTIYAFDNTGKECNATIKLMRGSSDDKYLQTLLDSYKRDPAAFILLTGNFVKRMGDGKGNITRELYSSNGGIISKQPMTKDNAEGDTEQATVSYNIKFSNAERGLM